ncbi:hypothetical protein C8D87_109126 [Lentzea atacamensis]|uniref:Uncharacterized protein n=1 Tax=Lentzea atacamensis TaxID=531938 RepID=A0ABX9E059_9PSEU|nr:hypothetical protein [Lentzea atacamensis]RAS61682.1 hypothetical protein C8D87_109126 [Lentzea atacamensis]
MDLFVSTRPDGSGFYGSPPLAPGARCTFDPDVFFAQVPPRELDPYDGMVVHESPRDVVAWPCRIWRVTDVGTPVSEHPHLKFSRVRELTGVEEVPSWQFFGPHGDQVLTILDQAARLRQEQVDRIAAMDGTRERRLYEKHWDDGWGNSYLEVHRAVERAAEYRDDEMWRDARDCAVAAAWGLEQDLYTPAEREVLARRWTSVMGTHT